MNDSVDFRHPVSTLISLLFFKGFAEFIAGTQEGDIKSVGKNGWMIDFSFQ